MPEQNKKPEANLAAAPEPKQNLVEFNFEVLPSGSRPVVPVSGAWGGINAQGQILAHLYFEYPETAQTGSVIVDQNTGRVVRQNINGRNNHFKREIVATLSVPPDIAQALGSWFSNQAEKASSLLNPK